MSATTIPQYRDQTRTPVADATMELLTEDLRLSARQRAEQVEMAQRHHEERATLARRYGRLAETLILPLERKKGGTPSQPERRP